MNGILVRRPHRDTDTQGRWRCDNGTETGAPQLYAKWHQALQPAAKSEACGTVSLRASGGKKAVAHVSLGLLASASVREYVCVVLCLLVCGTLLVQP